MARHLGPHQVAAGLHARGPLLGGHRAVPGLRRLDDVVLLEDAADLVERRTGRDGHRDRGHAGAGVVGRLAEVADQLLALVVDQEAADDQHRERQQDRQAALALVDDLLGRARLGVGQHRDTGGGPPRDRFARALEGQRRSGRAVRPRVTRRAAHPWNVRPPARAPGCAAAAAASMTPRCSLARRPPSRSRRDAMTVVSRSSTSRTGTGVAAARRRRPFAHLDRRRSLRARQGRGQPHDDLDRLDLGQHRQQVGDLALPRLHGRVRRGQHAVRVAPRDPDPGVAPVEPDPHPSTKAHPNLP